MKHRSFTVITIKGTPWVIDYCSAKATGYDSGSKATTVSDSYITWLSICRPYRQSAHNR